MTKCTFHKFGPSGTVEKFDGLCVLPLNIINEKIYVFLWFWFIILTVITGMQVIYRLVLCFVHPIFSSFGQFSCVIFSPFFHSLAHLALQNVNKD